MAAGVKVSPTTGLSAQYMRPQFPQAHAFDSVLPDKQQQALSDQFLAPDMENIMSGIAKIRAKVDEHFESLKTRDNLKGERRHLSGLTDIQAYPYGYCERIRDMVWNSLRKNLQNPNAGQGHFVALRDFLNAGGLFRKIWGELTHGPYFQNAMQVGSYYLDASNDTVVVTKPKLEVMPLAETNFRNIDSFEHYFNVAASYYQWDAYPNTFFPEIAPLYPAVAIHKQSGVMLVCAIPLPLMYKNMESGGELAAGFLANSSYAEKPLPRFYRTILDDHHRSIWAKSDTENTDQFEAKTVSDTGCELRKAFLQLRAWLSHNHEIATYQNALTHLDNARKQFDRSLRRYSLQQQPTNPDTITEV